MQKEATIEIDLWETIEINQSDLELLNNHLIELETPLSPKRLIRILIANRLQSEQDRLTEEKTKGDPIYLPKNSLIRGDIAVFSELNWQRGEVINVRPGNNEELPAFKVAEVKFDDGAIREFAIRLNDHQINTKTFEDDDLSFSEQDIDQIVDQYGSAMIEKLISKLESDKDFVYIAGRWFPKTLIVEINQGNLNLAEALLDMASGGPLSTIELAADVGLPEGVNQHLAEFSLDLALQDDERFDEVGPEGTVAWFLKKAEPQAVNKTPIYLRVKSLDYDRDLLTAEMKILEEYVDDELSPIDSFANNNTTAEVQVRLIFPHWRAGTLPLTPRIRKLFPTAYESPRIRFMIKDGDTGEKFPGWVVRLEKYVFGLGDWYRSRGLEPGSYVNLKHGDKLGEVIVRTEPHRSNKEWVRSAIIGTDNSIVYALLKQSVTAKFDERMMVHMPSDISALELMWENGNKLKIEDIVIATFRELAKINPQRHVHVTELYSAVNMRMRIPPGPIMALMASRSEFVHVGDLHFRYESNQEE